MYTWESESTIVLLFIPIKSVCIIHKKVKRSILQANTVDMLFLKKKTPRYVPYESHIRACCMDAGSISSLFTYTNTSCNLLCAALGSLPPPTKLGQGNIFRSVCQEFCPQGGGMYGRGECMARGGMCVWWGGMHGRGGICGRGCAWQGGACVAYGQWAGGTHPTGMHSCYIGVCSKPVREAVLYFDEHRKGNLGHIKGYCCVQKFETSSRWTFIALNRNRERTAGSSATGDKSHLHRVARHLHVSLQMMTLYYS